MTPDTPSREPDLSVIDSPEHREHARIAGQPRPHARQSRAFLAWIQSRSWLLEHGLICELTSRPNQRQRAVVTPIAQGATTHEGRVAAAAKRRQARRDKARLKITSVATIKAEPVAWLWPGVLPAGRVSGILGRQGSGKSTLMGWLASQVSTGRPWPGHAARNVPGSVLVLQAEESRAEDIRPRLDAMEADLTRIHLIDAVLPDGADATAQATFRLNVDVDLLERTIDEIGDVRLVVIDPIGSFLGDCDARSDTDVRAVLAPLVALAESRKVAVVFVIHPSKNADKDIMDRAANSGAFTQVCRIIWYYSVDPRKRGQRMLSLVKGNLRGTQRHAISAKLANERIGWDTRPVKMDAFQVDHSLQRIAFEERTRERPGPAGSSVHVAKELIMDYLREKGASSRTMLMAHSRQSEIRKTTFDRALQRLIERDRAVERYEDNVGRVWIRLITSTAETPPENAPESPDPGA